MDRENWATLPDPVFNTIERQEISDMIRVDTSDGAPKGGAKKRGAMAMAIKTIGDL